MTRKHYGHLLFTASAVFGASRLLFSKYEGPEASNQPKQLPKLSRHPNQQPKHPRRPTRKSRNPRHPRCVVRAMSHHGCALMVCPKYMSCTVVTYIMQHPCDVYYVAGCIAPVIICHGCVCELQQLTWYNSINVSSKYATVVYVAN
jgi:hypothetical protein